MFAIQIQFPAHRYHATPWGSHVNEGAVEWPPSLWRLVRAFYSVGYTHLGWTEKPPEGFDDLVNVLASSPPAYSLPESVETHSRHYMPIRDGRKETTTKVFDTCRRIIDQQSLWLRFDVPLMDDQRQLLESLVLHMGYLGRAESWVDAKLVTDLPDGLTWHQPTDQWSRPKREKITRRLLAPETIDRYSDWYQQELTEALNQETEQRGKKLTASQTAKIEDAFPKTIVDCLSVDTEWLQKHGWSQPPGTRWLYYAFDLQASDPVPPSLNQTNGLIKTSVSSEKKPTSILLGLNSQSVSGRTLPPIGMGLRVAELIHKAALKAFPDYSAAPPTTFTGRDAGGRLGRHEHAHFFPLDLDADKKVDHCLIYSAVGFDDDALHAIASIPAIYSGKFPLTRLTWVGAGSLDAVRGQIHDRSGNLSRLLTPSRRFESLTPYVASRHLKRNYKIADNIADECRFRNLPKPTSIQIHRANGGAFRLARSKEIRQPPRQQGQFVSLEFDQTIDVPLALGYGSHFGLGVFRAV